jgi:hypothetical protein
MPFCSPIPAALRRSRASTCWYAPRASAAWPPRASCASAGLRCIRWPAVCRALEDLPMHFKSKLPDVGTTIFTVMSRRALEEGALNIGQGFPDYPIDPRLGAVARRGRGGGTQSIRAHGRRDRAARADRASSRRATAIEVDPQTEITVTCGGTEALYDAIQAVVGPAMRPSFSIRPTMPTSPRCAWRAAAACASP